MCMCCALLNHFSHVQLFATPWTVTCHLPTGFSRHEYWRGLPCPSTGDLPDQGIELECLGSPALAGRFFTVVPPGKPMYTYN